MPPVQLEHPGLPEHLGRLERQEPSVRLGRKRPELLEHPEHPGQLEHLEHLHMVQQERLERPVPTEHPVQLEHLERPELP